MNEKTGQSSSPPAIHTVIIVPNFARKNPSCSHRLDNKAYGHGGAQEKRHARAPWYPPSAITSVEVFVRVPREAATCPENVRQTEKAPSNIR